MLKFRVAVLAVFIALGAGCGSKTEPSDGKSGGDPKPKASIERITLDNLRQLQPGVSTLNDARQLFASQGEMTNDEKPGLMPGSRWVFKEDGKRAYVSIDLNGKVNGIAWEGFGGR